MSEQRDCSTAQNTTLTTKPSSTTTDSSPPPPQYKDVVSKEEDNGAGSHADDDPQFTYKFDSSQVAEAAAMASNNDFPNPSPPQPSQNHIDQTLFPLRVFHISEYFYRNVYTGREDEIGSTWMFLIGFAVAFSLNGIGLLVILCLTSTLAVRCGAFCGFGLFIIKWALVIQTKKFENEPMRVGLFLLLFGFGSFIFLHGLLVFVLAKRHATLSRRLNVVSARAVP